MKKKILTIFASFILLFSAAYANDNGSKVPANVQNEFGRLFFFASNVNWETSTGYYKASFNAFDKTLFAFYTAEGDFMGAAANILSTELPASLQSRLKKDYSNFWITGLFTVVSADKSSYFVELENGDQKIMLKAEEGQAWAFYKQIKKD